MLSYLLAFVGFAVLIILHELGHFAAAKAVGMRVERFSLFFGPMLVKTRRGETEYGIGPIPLGGYVKITGMDPREELPPEIAPRAYYRQPVWKRVVVIAAGPAVNIVLALLIIAGLYVSRGAVEPTRNVDRIERGSPAAQVLQPGDEIVAVDGRRGGLPVLSAQIGSHRCAGKPVDGCRASSPARVTVRRDGVQRNVLVTPRFDAQEGRTRIGFAFKTRSVDVGPLEAIKLSAQLNWRVTRETVKAIGRIFYDSRARKEVSGVVGSYEVTRQSFEFDTARALQVLGLISLSLAVINLFPFLPLDGGHIFWALTEKIRGRPIPFSVLERVSVFGFLLVIALFMIGLSNDVNRLTGEGFRVR